jgi:hypothetical protein
MMLANFNTPECTSGELCTPCVNPLTMMSTNACRN